MQLNSMFVVDDDVFHHEIMKQILSEAGINQVTCFESGVDCLNEIHKNPEVVFLDQQMDVYSGFDTLRKIKRYNPNVFIVMVSAQEDVETAVNTIKYGSFDYIIKNENMAMNIKNVLTKIEKVKEMLKEKQPSLFKKLLKSI